jgi:DNA-3-methyladenine glycosylase I
MRDYKAIFEAFESTLLNVISLEGHPESVKTFFEDYKHREGRKFSDDEHYTKMVHIIFYSGFRASTVTDKLPIIDKHFPNYRTASRYADTQIGTILNDPQMIKNRNKIRACGGANDQSVAAKGHGIAKRVGGFRI